MNETWYEADNIFDGDEVELAVGSLGTLLVHSRERNGRCHLFRDLVLFPGCLLPVRLTAVISAPVLFIVVTPAILRCSSRFHFDQNWLVKL